MRVTKCDKCGRESDPEDREGAKDVRVNFWCGPKINADLCQDCALELHDIIVEFLRPGLPKDLEHG